MVYRIVHDPALVDIVGETKAEQQLIKLRPGQGPDYEADTVLHEAIHAMLSHAPIDLEHELEEKVCLVLAPALLDLLRRNPKLVAYLLDG